MPTNYDILKESEINLLAILNEFIDHVMSTQDLLYQKIKDHAVDAEFMKIIDVMEKKSNFYEADILEECSWIIMRDQPRASHLRFIIAVLNSIKDFERMGDYAVNIGVYFLHHPTMDREIYDLITDALALSIATVKKTVKASRELKAIEAYELSVKYNEEYRKSYTQTMVELSQIIRNREIKQVANLLSGSVVVLKNIERNVDHIMNVMENFAYIKKFDFFYTRHDYHNNK